MAKESAAKQRPAAAANSKKSPDKTERQGKHDDQQQSTSRASSASPNTGNQQQQQQQRSQKKQPAQADAGKKSQKHRRTGKSKFGIPIHVWLGICAIIGLGVLKYYSEQSEKFDGFGSNRSADAVSHYEVLGVSKSASSSQIRQAYMKKAKENHPDTCPECADTFQRIATAYQILSDPTSRQAYDSADADVTLIASEASKIAYDNVDEILGARHPVVIVQVYNDWSYEAKAFAQMWERAVEKLGTYMTFARLHETKDAGIISRLIPVRTRLIPALAVFIHGKFQRLIPTGMKYTELDNNLVSVYPDKVVQLKGEDDVLKFAKSSPTNVVVFTQGGKSTMLLKHAALLFEGLLNVGVTSVPAKSVYQSLQVAEPPNERSLLLSQNADGKRFWRAISSPADLISALRTDLAGQVPVLTSAWQYNALCRSPNVDCVLAVSCKSKSTNKDFIAESRHIRVGHLRSKNPIHFAVADFKEARNAFCTRESPESLVIALQDADQMSVKPSSSSMSEFFASFADADRRADMSWRNAPKVYARRSSGRWGWNWILGITLFAVTVFLIGSFWSSTTMVLAMTILMASSIIFQFDWILPLIRGLFKF